jgi:hypothetical protein
MMSTRKKASFTERIDITDDDRRASQEVIDHQAPAGLDKLIHAGKEAYGFMLRAEGQVNKKRMDLLKIVYDIKTNHFDELEEYYKKDFVAFLEQKMNFEDRRKSRDFSKVSDFLTEVNKKISVYPEVFICKNGDLFYLLYRLAHITDKNDRQRGVDFQMKWLDYILNNNTDYAFRETIGNEIKEFKQISDKPIKKINPSNGFAIKLYPNKQTIKVNDNDHYEKIILLLDKLTPEKYEQVLQVLNS